MDVVPFRTQSTLPKQQFWIDFPTLLPCNMIWANQPIHSFLVGCLNTCLQGTNVHVGSSQPCNTSLIKPKELKYNYEPLRNTRIPIWRRWHQCDTSTLCSLFPMETRDRVYWQLGESNPMYCTEVLYAKSYMPQVLIPSPKLVLSNLILLGCLCLYMD